MIIGADTETALFGPGKQIPELACVSLSIDGHGSIVHHTDVDLGFVAWLLEQDTTWHNASYDMAVFAGHVPEAIPLIFEAYAAERIHCTKIREQLIDLAHGDLGMPKKGKYFLETLALKYLGKQLDKDTYRLGYGELRALPLADWPQGAIDYPIEDAHSAKGVFDGQAKLLAKTDDAHVLVDANRQTAYDFAFKLLSAWGMRTDPDRVRRLKSDTLAELVRMQDELVARGLMRIETVGKRSGNPRQKISRNLSAIREAVMDAYGDSVPTTGKGNISTSRETIEKHPKLKVVSDYVALEKLNSTYIKVLEEGIHAPIHGQFHLLATGRRGADKNMQTLPKYGPVRSCYRPRKGYVFGTVDYDSLEMRTWAQLTANLFGIDNMPLAQLYRDDPNADPHTKFAAEHFMHIPYEDGMALKKSAEQAEVEGRSLTKDEQDVKRFRQASKPFNFGLPGGLGVQRFVDFAYTQYGFEISVSDAKRGIKGWKDTWNAWKYFEYVAYMENNYGWVEQEVSKRIRGGLGYCDLANTGFQGLAADGCMLSLFLCAWACYAMVDFTALARSEALTTLLKPDPKPRTALFGSRIVNSLHDELVFEFPEENASAAIHEAMDIMVGGMSRYCPDVPIRVSGALMTRWLKDAPCIMRDGEMQVYEVP